MAGNLGLCVIQMRPTENTLFGDRLIRLANNMCSLTARITYVKRNMGSVFPLYPNLCKSRETRPQVITGLVIKLPLSRCPELRSFFSSYSN